MTILFSFIAGLLAISGLPLFVLMCLIALFAFTQVGIDTSASSIAIYSLAAQPTLISIPLFTFAGQLMAESKSPQRILDLAHSLFGRLPGGVAIVCLVVCAFFTAFTGASGVTIIALGGILYPVLRDEKYSDAFTLGLISTAGSLGLLFPPSLPIILYGLVARVEISEIFKAGLIPGILLIVVLSAYALYKAPKKDPADLKKLPPFSMREVVMAVKGSFWELLLPIGILVGIYGGYTTAQEAAACTAVYVLIMECFIYRDIKLNQLPKVVVDSSALVGAILLILCCATAVTDFVIDEEIPSKILMVIKENIHNKYAFLIFLNIFLLIIGCMMDIFSAIIVVVPLIVPISKEYGIDPVHLAIIFLTNLEIGYITPPVGINLFISSFRFKKPITELYVASLPFLLCLIFALLIITYIPSLVLFWF